MDEERKMLNKKYIIIIASVLFFMVLAIGSYLYKRNYSSIKIKAVSPPPEIDYRFITIYYDKYYSMNYLLYYLHIPLAYLDDNISRYSDIEIRIEDYKGNSDNYQKEEYN